MGSFGLKIDRLTFARQKFTKNAANSLVTRWIRLETSQLKSPRYRCLRTYTFNEPFLFLLKVRDFLFQVRDLDVATQIMSCEIKVLN